MNRNSFLICAATAAFFVIRHSSFVMAQGSLTPPPGAPVPTMKTLDQVEARTPISSAPLTVTTPGSYYLTGNLAVTTGDAININASDVTLDLNGFTLSSTASPASGTAVVISNGRRNITIRNGHIRGTTTFSAGTFTTGGFLDGIRSSVSAANANFRVSEVSVAGVGDDAIDLADTTVPSFVVERCNVAICGGIGIQAGVVRDCLVSTAGSKGIFADIVTDSCAESVDASAFGEAVRGNALVDNCRGVAVGGVGVRGEQVRNSSGVSVTATGLAAGAAQNCQGSSNTNIGLNADTALACQGLSVSGVAGLNAAQGTASFCRGGRNGGNAISTGVDGTAIGCTVTGTGTVFGTKKFLGTP